MKKILVQIIPAVFESESKPPKGYSSSVMKRKPFILILNYRQAVFVNIDRISENYRAVGLLSRGKGDIYGKREYVIQDQIFSEQGLLNKSIESKDNY